MSTVRVKIHDAWEIDIESWHQYPYTSTDKEPPFDFSSDNETYGVSLINEDSTVRALKLKLQNGMHCYDKKRHTLVSAYTIRATKFYDRLGFCNTINQDGNIELWYSDNDGMINFQVFDLLSLEWRRTDQFCLVYRTSDSLLRYEIQITPS